MLNEDPEKLSSEKREPLDSNRGMLARELARIGLGLNFYTQWYWKIDLYNLFHFLGLRMDPHAQWEIREYANEMGRITRTVAPNAYQAFGDYIFSSMNFSGPELKIMRQVISSGDSSNLETLSKDLPTKRESVEFLEKMKKLLEEG